MKYYKQKNQYTAYIDVDETLIMWNNDVNDPTTKVLDLPNGNLVIKLHKKHIQLVKNLYAIGWNVTVWSQGGSDHAETVIKQIGLADHVHEIMNKPVMYLDDKPFENQGIRRSYHEPD